MKHLLPEGWPRPKGYANGVEAEGRQVFVAGMIGWNEAGEFLRFSATYEAADEVAEDRIMQETQRRLSSIKLQF